MAAEALLGELDPPERGELVQERQLTAGASPLVQTQRNKPAVIALREVATGKVRFEGDVRATLSRPPPTRGVLEAAVNATEIDRAKGPDPFHRWDR